MARTTSAGSTHVGSIIDATRQRPTTYVSRKNRDKALDVNLVAAVEMISDSQEHEEGFPRGPSDTSLLVYYVDHVALKLWDDKVSKQN